MTRRPDDERHHHSTTVGDTAAVPSWCRARASRAACAASLGLILRIACCLVFGLPLVFMIVSSFKPDLQIFGDLGTWNAFLPVGDICPGQLHRACSIGCRSATFLMNSMLISVITVVLGLIVNRMARSPCPGCTSPGRRSSSASSSPP